MGVFQLGRIIANNLKYPQKFLLIFCLFAVPLTILTYSVFLELNDRVNFSQKEIHGVEYLLSLQKLDEQVLQAQINRQSISNVNEFGNLEIIDQKLGGTLATKDKFALLKLSYDREITSPRKLHLQIQDLRDHVGNTSNLIFDPDLDTYYLDDITLVVIKQL